ncbi:MAG: hypothetical protein HY719_00360 [Planctomycetes bacterium]|nr:hypothetical protein [Planctomycetota bacterium]
MVKTDTNRWNLRGVALVSTFAQAPAPSVTDKWWKRVSPVAPDSRRADGPPEAPEAWTTGVLENEFAALALGVARNEVIWALLPIASPKTADRLRRVPAMGACGEVLDLFESLIKKWYSHSDLPLLDRQGVKAALVADAGSSQNEALRIMAPCLKTVHIDTENSCDFVYQVNRPAPSKVLGGGTHLNVLSKCFVDTAKPREALSEVGVSVDADVPEVVFAATVALEVGTQRGGPRGFKASMVLFREYLWHIKSIARTGIRRGRRKA